MIGSLGIGHIDMQKRHFQWVSLEFVVPKWCNLLPPSPFVFLKLKIALLTLQRAQEDKEAPCKLCETLAFLALKQDKVSYKSSQVTETRALPLEIGYLREAGQDSRERSGSHHFTVLISCMYNTEHEANQKYCDHANCESATVTSL